MDDQAQLESGKKRKLAEHHIAGNILAKKFKTFLSITLTYFICSVLCFTFVLERNESKHGLSMVEMSKKISHEKNGLLHLLGVPHLHVNRPLDTVSCEVMTELRRIYSRPT